MNHICFWARREQETGVKDEEIDRERERERERERWRNAQKMGGCARSARGVETLREKVRKTESEGCRKNREGREL